MITENSLSANHENKPDQEEVLNQNTSENTTNKEEIAPEEKVEDPIIENQNILTDAKKK